MLLPYGSGYKKLTSSKDKQDYVTEYNRQLSRQQQALNNMSAAQIKRQGMLIKRMGDHLNQLKEQKPIEINIRQIWQMIYMIKVYLKV